MQKCYVGKKGSSVGVPSGLQPESGKWEVGRGRGSPLARKRAGQWSDAGVKALSAAALDRLLKTKWLIL